AILEDVMMDIMFDIPSKEGVTGCRITKETIEKTAAPILSGEGIPPKRKSPARKKQRLPEQSSKQPPIRAAVLILYKRNRP
ncbi:MAG: hypothetical protein IJF41_02985, partial [Clostridia bacterium]|nr:hypothetical protein [Clostridia bacterium]